MARCANCIRRHDDCEQGVVNELCGECKKRQVKCLLSVGQTQGRKRKIAVDEDEERDAGASFKKKTRVASPRRHGNSKDEINKWRQHIVDVLEIANVERHAARTQLEGLQEVLNVANIEQHVMWVQLEGICTTFKYVAGLTYKVYIRSRISRESKRGEGTSQGGGR